MKELSLQIQGTVLTPFMPEDLEVLKNFKDNQVVRAKLYGTKKERSLTQLGLLHACMRVVSDTTEDEEWNTPEKVKFQIKIRLKFVDLTKSVFIDGVMHFHYRSFAFAELEHMEACGIFEQAFDLMADKLQITKNTLIEEAQDQMISWR